MRVRLLAFASAAEALGDAERELELPDGTTAGTLRARLLADHPAFAPLLPRLAIAVDGQVVGDDAPLVDGAEVALLPPVSGGAAPGAAARAWITEEPLDAAAVTALVASPGYGATVVFVGTVRDHLGGRAVERLSYIAYASMAEQRMERIVAELEAAHGARLAIAHRVGTLQPGEPSVVIAVAAPHREAAYAASRECLERIKREVPVWKREHYAGGEARWREEEGL